MSINLTLTKMEQIEGLVGELTEFDQLVEIKVLLKKARTRIQRQRRDAFRERAQVGDRVVVAYTYSGLTGHECTIIDIPRQRNQHILVEFDVSSPDRWAHQYHIPAWGLELI